MIERISVDALKDGQNLQAFLMNAPCEKWTDSILALAYEIEAVRLNKLWQWQIGITVKGEANEGLETLFYVGVVCEKPIALMTLFLSGPAGIIGFTATAAAYRRKGAMEILLRNLLGDCRKRGCRVVTTNTRYKGALYSLLEKYGFKSLGVDPTNLILEMSPGALQSLFVNDPVRTEKLGWKHFPLVDKLYCFPEGAHIRSVANRAFGPGTYEGGFVADMKAVLEGRAECCVLESAEGSVLGHACVRPDEIWAMEDVPPNSRILDFFVHPTCVGHLLDLLRTFDLGKGKTLCFVDADSSDALAVLKRIGFRSEGRMKNQTVKGDVEVMGFGGFN